MIQPCPCCGQAVIVLPSGQLTTPTVVTEVADLIDLGDETLDAIRSDPDIRANVGEFFQVEDLDED